MKYIAEVFLDENRGFGDFIVLGVRYKLKGKFFGKEEVWIKSFRKNDTYWRKELDKFLDKILNMPREEIITMAKNKIIENEIRNAELKNNSIDIKIQKVKNKIGKFEIEILENEIGK